MTVRTDLELLVSAAARRPMLTVCPVAGCRRLTMGGGTCVEHDAPVAVTFPRGRPFVRTAEVAAVAKARVVPLV